MMLNLMLKRAIVGTLLTRGEHPVELGVVEHGG